MKKKTSSSLTKFDVARLSKLHALILDFTGDPVSWAHEKERLREKAFNVRTNHKLFKYWYLRSEVLKRFQGKGTSAKLRKESAIGTFLQLEASAAELNDRLSDGWGKPWPETIRRQLIAARRVIGEVLGTQFPWEQFPLACDFSSGAATDLPRLEAARQKKWINATDVTSRALPYALAFRKWANLDQVVPSLDGPYTGERSSFSRGGHVKFSIVTGNKVFTVPKRFDTDRTCAKEPSWNMFLQKGVGTLIRSRLNQIGLLHPDAQATHAYLAEKASRDGVAATLDLKGASDLVTVGLTALLYPPAWTKVLLDLRSQTGELPNGETLTYEKISSMGNGNTFELETLTFYGLAKACCRDGEEVSVYGDDLICPAHRVKAITKLFKFVGFELNQEKSFHDGPFRESCGGHFWRGVNVKPFYVERLPTTHYEIINLHNDIVEWMETGPIVDRLVAIARECRQLIPRKYWGPRFTAGVIASEWDEARPTFQRPPSRREQPYYGHWRVKSIRREVIVQKHDYFLGSLLDEYWQKRHVHTNPTVRTVGSFGLRQAALSRQREERRASSTADFSFALTREVEGWVVVGVGLDWPRLPVRLA